MATAIRRRCEQMRSTHSYAKFLVVGAGPTGMYLARHLAESAQVRVIDSDTDTPATTENRARFVYALTGPGDDPTSQYSPAPHANIEVSSGCRAETLDLAARVLVTQDGERIVFEQLILALGASPVIPAFARRSLRGVQTAYYHRDIQALARARRAGESIAIVGGGPLAVELASVLAATATVSLFVRQRLLRHYCNADIGWRVADHLRSLGVAVESGFEPDALLGDEHVRLLRLNNGQLFSADRVVLACGVRAVTGQTETLFPPGCRLANLPPVVYTSGVFHHVASITPEALA